MQKNKNRKYIFYLLSLFFVFGILFRGTPIFASYNYESISFYTQVTPNSYVAEGTAYYAHKNQTADSLPVYRFLNNTNGVHFYTISESEKNSIIANDQNWTYEGISYYAYTSEASGTSPVYRFYNPTKGVHLYTISGNEKKIIEENSQWGYTYEGIVYYAYKSQVSETSPVYRFYNPSKGAHFYTISTEEKNGLIKTNSSFLYEGVAFYAQISQISGTSPVYRFFNPSKGVHFYTISESEKNSIIANDQNWTYEGISYYAYTSEASGTSPVYRFYNPTKGVHFFTISEAEKNSLIKSYLGPEISVGLVNYSRTDLKNEAFEINAKNAITGNPMGYVIKDENGSVLATIEAGKTTKIKYISAKKFTVYNSVSPSLTVSEEVRFESVNDGESSDIIFHFNRPSSDFHSYRGKIKLNYYTSTDSNVDDSVWAINTLPLEHYVWGMGEMRGTGPMEHSKVMTTIFRTYGMWYIQYATKYTPYGFKIRSDSGSQIYSGNDWEESYPNIKTAAEGTRGIVAKYGDEVALTPYSSWSDGRTRSFKERWGSSAYPWCKSVSDPYGKNSTMTTAELEAAGNHMVGLIANGSLKLAGDEHNWSWDRILKYYFTNINLLESY